MHKPVKYYVYYSPLHHSPSIPHLNTSSYQHFQSRRPGFALSRPQTRRLLVVAGVAGGVVLVLSQEEVPYTQRSHAILVNAGAEQQMGEQAYEEILAEAARDGTLVPAQHPAAQRVVRVGRRIAAVVENGKGGGFQAHVRNLHWRFSVIHSPQVNAFVVPGGNVVVYTGLLDLVGSDDELAAVLAHECAHVLARHAAERMTRGSVLSALQLVAYWGFGIAVPTDLLAPAFFLPNSRKQETEADLIGIQLAAQACFDPAAAVTVFEKLGEVERRMGGGRIPGFLRTHPVSSQRIERIKEVREAGGERVQSGSLGRGFVWWSSAR